MFSQKNTELNVFLAGQNGFGDEGGKAIVQASRQINVMKELDLSANRMTDGVIKAMSSSMDGFTSIEDIDVSSA